MGGIRVQQTQRGGGLQTQIWVQQTQMGAANTGLGVQQTHRAGIGVIKAVDGMRYI